MKKVGFFLVLLTIMLSLTSCTVNWFGGTVDVPWYFVAIPILLISIFGYFILMSKTYICPCCKTEFKAKPHQLYVTVHMGGKRIAKCPNCGRKGFCEIKKVKWLKMVPKTMQRTPSGVLFVFGQESCEFLRQTQIFSLHFGRFML